MGHTVKSESKAQMGLGTTVPYRSKYNIKGAYLSKLK